MGELVSILEELDSTDVHTYIQSGNAVFRKPEAKSLPLSARIAAEVEERRGFTPHILLLDLDRFHRVIAENPFPEATEAPTTLHVGFLAETPTHPDLEAIETLRAESERYYLSSDAFYLHAPHGIGRSKLSARAERHLGVPMTDRNWRTVCAVRDLAADITSGAAGSGTSNLGTG
jgi:uncharacterized protein (DUF1697 family)